MLFISEMFSATLDECEKEEQQFQAKIQAKEAAEKEQVAKSNSAPAATLDELIINCVATKSPLWGGSMAKKFPSQWNQLWEEVCTEIGQPITKREQIKKIWFGLKEKFRNARKIALKPKKSGAAANKKFKSNFVFYEEMMFMVDSIDVPE